MTEYLALPAWKTPDRSVDDWVASLSGAAGGPVAVKREGSSVAWLVVEGLRLRGYALIEGGHVAAINFELQAADHAPAARAIAEAAEALGWEVHEDDDEADEDDDDDRD